MWDGLYRLNNPGVEEGISRDVSLGGDSGVPIFVSA